MVLRRIMFGLIALFTVSALIACSEETEISSIQVDQDTVQSNFFIEDFELDAIQLELTHDNGDEEILPVTEAMISQDDLDKLSQPGIHTIEIEYENLSTSLELKMIDVITIGVDSYRMGDALVKKWNEDNPDDEGLVEFTDYGAANDDDSGMEGIDLRQEEAPDIALVIDNEVTARKDVLLPLNDDLAEIGEQQTREYAFESINEQDNFFLPAVYDTMVFSWNETILTEMGIDTTDSNDDNLPDAIDTWEKIFAIAEDIPADDRPEIDVPEYDESNTMYEIFPISLDEVWSGYPALTAGGWQIFEDEVYTDPGFDSDEFEAGLGFIEEFSKHNMSVDETGSKKAADEMGWRWQDYLDGAYPMSLVGSWEDIEGDEEETGFDFRFSQMPTYDGEDLHALTKTKGFVINGFTPLPEEAQRVMDWLYTSDTFDTIINNSAYLPALQEDADLYPDFDDENKDEFEFAMEKNHFETAETLPDNFDVHAMNAFYDIHLNNPMKEIWDGDQTPSEARASIAKEIEAWIEANNQ